MAPKRNRGNGKPESNLNQLKKNNKSKGEKVIQTTLQFAQSGL